MRRDPGCAVTSIRRPAAALERHVEPDRGARCVGGVGPAYSGLPAVGAADAGGVDARDRSGNRRRISRAGAGDRDRGAVRFD